MSVHRAVARLHHDLSRLHRAERELKQDQRELGRDRKELKQDRRELGRDRKDLKQDVRQVGRDQKVLGNRIEAKDAALTGLDARKQGVADQLAADTFDYDPVAPGVQQNPALLQQLADLTQRRSEVAAGFGTRIDADRADLSRAREVVKHDRVELKQDHKDLKHGRKVVKHDHFEIQRDHERVREVRKKALHDLRPAEYHMGLKGTNRARRDLGLEPVHHVIRPDDVSGSAKKQMKALVNTAISMSGGKSPGGYCLGAVQNMLDRTHYGRAGDIPRFSYAHQFGDFLNQANNCQKYGLKKLNIDNPYDAPAGAIVVVRAGTPGTAHPFAGDIVVAAGNGRFLNDGEMGYGGPQNFPRGNNHVIGIYVPR